MGGIQGHPVRTCAYVNQSRLRGRAGMADKSSVARRWRRVGTAFGSQCGFGLQSQKNGGGQQRLCDVYKNNLLLEAPRCCIFIIDTMGATHISSTYVSTC